jgi:hypothetical protein
MPENKQLWCRKQNIPVTPTPTKVGKLIQAQLQSRYQAALKKETTAMGRGHKPREGLFFFFSKSEKA